MIVDLAFIPGIPAVEQEPQSTTLEIYTIFHQGTIYL